MTIKEATTSPLTVVISGVVASLVCCKRTTERDKLVRNQRDYQSMISVAFLAIALQLALTTATPVSRRSDVQSGDIIVITLTPPTDQCETFEHPYCNLFGHNRTKLPNKRGQDMGAARSEFSHFEPLLRDNRGQTCSEYLGILLCFHYFPLCTRSNSVRDNKMRMLSPCRHICELAKEGCEEHMPNGWPEHLNCSELPVQDPERLNCAGPDDPPTNPTRPRPREPEDPSESGFGVPCVPPTDPSNGQVSLGETGSEATYSCNDGYQLSGESRRLCQSDGEWSGSEPSCERQCRHVACPRCNLRTKCNSNTFKRNGYTFAAWVTLRQIMENTACNRSYEVEVQRQYATGAPTMGSRIQVDTTSGFRCPPCPESGGDHELRLNQEYLIAGYYEENPLRWYLDNTDSLVSAWTRKYEKNMENWVGRRSP